MCIRDRFGDNLYNIYGSTEVAYASIATPEDLRADPTSAGKPPYGTVVRILDEAGTELQQGETGRIFVGNGLLFEGYTHGGSKEVVDGLMSSGDVGWFDDAGRLHLAATVPHTRALVWWLLGFGDGVVIQEPASLREELAGIARRMHAAYA